MNRTDLLVKTATEFLWTGRMAMTLQFLFLMGLYFTNNIYGNLSTLFVLFALAFCLLSMICGMIVHSAAYKTVDVDKDLKNFRKVLRYQSHFGLVSFALSVIALLV